MGLYYLCNETKKLISCMVTSQLICAFVFAYAKNRFSYDTAHKVQRVKDVLLCIVSHQIGKDQKMLMQ